MNTNYDSTRYGPRAYSVDSTNLESVTLVNDAVSEINRRSTENPQQPIGEIVADVVDGLVDSSVYFHRLLVGGKHDLNKVIENASCFDIAVLVGKILSELGIQSEKKTNRLLLIPKHYFTVLDDGSVIDLFMRANKKKSGYFSSEDKYMSVVEKINSLGTSSYSKQIKKVFTGG